MGARCASAGLRATPRPVARRGWSRGGGWETATAACWSRAGCESSMPCRAVAAPCATASPAAPRRCSGPARRWSRRSSRPAAPSSTRRCASGSRAPALPISSSSPGCTSASSRLGSRCCCGGCASPSVRDSAASSSCCLAIYGCSASRRLRRAPPSCSRWPVSRGCASAWSRREAPSRSLRSPSCWSIPGRCMPSAHGSRSRPSRRWSGRGARP